MSRHGRGPRRSTAAGSAALVLSVGLHVALVVVTARYVRSLAPASQGPARPLDVSLVDLAPSNGVLPLGAPGADGLHETPPARPERASSGPVRESRPDTRSRGRGGSEEASAHAVHLSDSVDGLTQETDPSLLTPASQVSRLSTSDERLSREDRRATPHPMELTFLATGVGTRLARLEPAASDPSAGTTGTVFTPAGARRGEVDPAADGVVRVSLGSEREGSEPSVARGVERGRLAADYRRSAAVALARPAVRAGRASISTARKGRPNDTVTSAEEVASVVQSLVTASTAGGLVGTGPGGSRGGGAPGTGGTSGPGSVARASGDGGSADEAATLGLSSYTAALTRKVYPYWEDAFPMWARAEGRGGIAVIGVTLSPDGRVHDLRVVRGSGYPEFDRKVARALEEASPYGPLPRAVRDTGLTLHIAFDAMNPAVGRSGPGPGRR
jgi:TonB family protein